LQTIDFLNWLYDGIPIGWLTLWRKSDKRTFWYPIRSLEKMANDAAAMARKDEADVYYGVGVRKEKLQTGRGGNEDVLAVPALWVDIDIQNQNAHKQENLPQGTEAVKDFLSTLPFKPSIIIHSGYGIHAYWKLTDPIDTDTPDNLREALWFMQGWQRYVNAQAATRGWKLDSVHDAARVLRLPGTLNYKDILCPQNVEVLDFQPDRSYSISDFLNYGSNEPQNASEGKSEPYRGIGEKEHGKAIGIIEGCAFIRHCIENAARLPEPEWYAMITNLAPCLDGPEAIHDASRAYADYTVKETEDKISRARAENKPHSCEYIRRDLGFGCPEGGCGVKCPVGFASGRMIQLQIARTITPENAFTSEILNALAVIKNEYSGEYGALKASLKGLVNLNDLERAVTARCKELERVVDQTEKTLVIIEDYWPVPKEYAKLALPISGGWSHTPNAVFMVKETPKTYSKECASAVPIFLSRRIFNIEAMEEKLEIMYRRDGAWNKFSAPRSIVFDRRGLNRLGDRGLPVSSESAGLLVKYLQEFERVNLEAIPRIKAVSRMGWVTANQFVWGPDYGGEYELDPGDSPGLQRVASGFREKGTFAEWKQLANRVRKYPVARFTMAASFAAPLLKILNQRVFLIHIWGRSRGGKTASLKAALSVWGDPEAIMMSFNSTATAIERVAGFYNDLPLGIDERQVAGGDQESVEKMVYQIGQGKGRGRGTQDGGVQGFNQWRTIALSTGEEPLSRDSSTAGVKTRTIEIFGEPLGDDDALAGELHSITAAVHGHAGPEFIRRLMFEDPIGIEALFKTWTARMLEMKPGITGSHAQNIALVCLADAMASTWLFDQDPDQAEQEALAMAGTILASVEQVADVDDSKRAYEHMMNWLAMYGTRFNADRHSEFQQGVTYGWFHPSGDVVYINPTAFNEALKDGGFSPARIRREWGEMGLIQRDQDGKNTCVVRPPGSERILRVVVLMLKQYGYDDTDAPKLDVLKVI